MCFVFGVPARDLPGQYALELTYNKKRNAYYLNIETIYYFQTQKAEKKYYNRLLDEFTEYMIQAGFDTDIELRLNDLCYWKVREFKSIEKAYAWFKYIVESYNYMTS